MVLLININFNTHKKKYKNPFGAVLKGNYVLIQIEVDRDCEVYLVVENQSAIEKFKMNKHDFLYSYNLDTSNYTTTINYYFEISFEGKCPYYVNNKELLDGEGCPYTEKPKNFYQITVYKYKNQTNQEFLDAINIAKDYYKDKEKLNEMIIRAYNHPYTWPNQVKSYLKLYKELI